MVATRRYDEDLRAIGQALEARARRLLGHADDRRNSRRRLTKNPIKDESNQTKGEGETRVNAKDSHQVRHVILRRVLHDRIRSQRAQKFQPALSAGFFGVAKFVP